MPRSEGNEVGHHRPAVDCPTGRSVVHRYLEALAGVSDVPPAWQKVFATGRNRYTSVLEDMVFGMSAHIIADLRTC